MENKYEIEGKLLVVGETETVGAAGTFRKRTFVVELEDGKYPQQVPLEFTQDRCGELDGYSAGDTIRASFNLRGREYNGRYYVSLGAWRIERTGKAPVAQADPITEPEADDDLPF